MQAKTLEEIELQQPFFERTVRPIAVAPVGHRSQSRSTKVVGRTEKRLAQAGNPGDLRTVDWLGMKVHRRAVVAGVVLLLFGVVMGVIGLRRSDRCRGGVGV